MLEILSLISRTKSVDLTSYSRAWRDRERERESEFPLGRETWEQGTVNILSLYGNEAPLS